jgi:hypothetical protein
VKHPSVRVDSSTDEGVVSMCLLLCYFQSDGTVRVIANRFNWDSIISHPKLTFMNRPRSAKRYSTRSLTLTQPRKNFRQATIFIAPIARLTRGSD